MSRRDLGEEGMMYMLVLWDDTVSLGAVVLGYFVPFAKIKTAKRKTGCSKHCKRAGVPSWG